MHTVILPDDGTSVWAGMADYVLLTSSGQHRIELDYVGEPPFGDSYHHLVIDGSRLPGFAWGGCFVVTADGRYLAASWMRRLFERRTLIVDLERRKFWHNELSLSQPCFTGYELSGTDMRGTERRLALPNGLWCDFPKPSQHG